AELEEQEDTPDRAVRVGTGTTFREAWDADDTLESRRKMLRDSGVKITSESSLPFSADGYTDLHKHKAFSDADECRRRYGSVVDPSTQGTGNRQQSGQPPGPQAGRHADA